MTPRPTGRWPLGFIGLVALGLAAGISPLHSGFYQSSAWVPIGLAVLVAGGVAVAAGAPAPRGRAALAVAALAGLGIWSLASVAWSESAQQAVAEGNRILVLAAILGAALLLLSSDRRPAVLVATLGFGTLVVAAYVLARMLSGDPGDLFLTGRLNEPLGYINAEATVFAMGFWLCFAAAELRRPLLAALGAGGATLMACLVLLSQSRGAALAMVAALLVALIVMPGRSRRGFALLTIAGCFALAIGALQDVYDAGSTGLPVGDAAQTAATVALLCALAAAAIWGAATAAHARLARDSARAARLDRLGRGVLVAGLLGALVAALAFSGRIADRVDREYDAFVHLGAAPTGEPAPTTGSRLVSGAGTRYDYWRIAWRAFKDHPLDGLGAGNYDRRYFAERENSEDVRQPHSIELQTLSETGLVGGLLLVLFLAAVAAGAARWARAARSSETARAIGVAATGGFTAWLVHTSVDWMHLLPGLTAVALCLAAILLTDPERRDGDAGRRPPVAALVAVALLLAVAGASLTRQGLAETHQRRAASALPSDPAKALREAGRSLDIDDTAVEAYYAKAAALARLHRAQDAERTLLRAAAEEPSDFVTWTLLGDLAVRRGNLARAKAYYERASRLNPLDPTAAALAKDPAAALQ
jgi:hypothetical protein